MYTENEYLIKNPTWHVEDSPWKAGHILKILEKNNIHAKTVCEVGCGAGETLNQLYGKFSADVVFAGYDISPQAIELCQARKKDRLSFHLADFNSETTSTFDLLLAIDVVEHVEDYIGFLKNIRTRATYKIFHIPLDLSAQSVMRISPILSARENVGHLHYFTKDTALAALCDTGYEIIDYFYTGGTVELPAKSLKMTLARFPRKLFFKINRDLAVRALGGYSLMVLAR
jgi:2-polyprenyl-3-methyl-5-hydroxy-6-metoxy-1,4-benzoquinol methylase